MLPEMTAPTDIKKLNLNSKFSWLWFFPQVFKSSGLWLLMQGYGTDFVLMNILILFLVSCSYKGEW